MDACYFQPFSGKFKNRFFIVKTKCEKGNLQIRISRKKPPTVGMFVIIHIQLTRLNRLIPNMAPLLTHRKGPTVKNALDYEKLFSEFPAKRLQIAHIHNKNECFSSPRQIHRCIICSQMGHFLGHLWPETHKKGAHFKPAFFENRECSSANFWICFVELNEFHLDRTSVGEVLCISKNAN